MWTIVNLEVCALIEIIELFNKLLEGLVWEFGG